MDILSLLPNFGNSVYTLVAFVIALSIIVFVHEFGHYFIGRLSGIKAQVFSMGFGPVLFARTDHQGTRWQIAALPFGGYVKFMGDANAASAPDDRALAGLTAEERRATMQGAPLWARFATVSAGPLFNFALSILIFCGFFLVNGVATTQPIVGTLRPLPTASLDLQPGDVVLALAGQPTPDLATFISVADALPPADSVAYTVRRAEAELQISGPYPFPPIADAIQPKSAAIEAGLQKGDVVLAVDGAPISAFNQLRERVGASDGKPMVLSVWRDGSTTDLTLTPRRVDMPLADGGFETRWLLGVSGGLAFEPERRTPGLFEAISLGAQQIWFLVTSSLSGLWHMLTGAISTCNLQGPLGIAETSGDAASQGTASFVWFIAVLSSAVGLMNLFPIPVLDGGHLLFFTWEAITGKPPSDRALRGLMSVGLALLLGLMLFALSNDFFCA